MKKIITFIGVILVIGIVIYGVSYKVNEKNDEHLLIQKKEKKEKIKRKPYVYEASLYRLWKDEAKSKSMQEKSIVTKTDADEKKIHNPYAGYSFVVPNTWEVDEHVADEYVRLFTKTHRIDITKQDTRESWVFPERFIQNTINSISKYKTNQTKKQIGNFYATIVDYKREKIKGIDDDMNFYSYYFLTNHRDVFVFQLKTTEEEFQTKKNEVEKLLETFSLEKKEDVPLVKNKVPYAYQNQSLFIPDKTFVMGIYLENAYEIEALEEKLSSAFGAQLLYKSIASDYDYYVEDLIKKNKIPVVTFLFEEVGKEEPVIFDVLSGKYDKNIKRWAVKTKELKEDVLFRVANEMNGDWSKWSHLYIYNDPDIYKMAYRHVASIFKKEHANNAKFVWNPNNTSSPYYQWNKQEMYYPGDEFVDWIGLTAYNWGKTKWQEFKYFDELYDNLYHEYEYNHPNKPFIIAEFSSDEQGGDKARFINEAFTNIATKYPKIKIAMWFNQDHGDNYLKIESSSRSFEAFKKGMDSENVIQNAYK